METYCKKSCDKKSRPSIFDLWTPELSNFDVSIGFLVQNCVYKQPKHKDFPDSRTEIWNFLSYVSTVRLFVLFCVSVLAFEVPTLYLLLG